MCTRGPHITVPISAGDTYSLATVPELVSACYLLWRERIADLSPQSRFQRFAPRAQGRFDLPYCFRWLMLTLPRFVEAWQLRVRCSRQWWRWGYSFALAVIRLSVAILRHETRAARYRCNER